MSSHEDFPSGQEPIPGQDPGVYQPPLFELEQGVLVPTGGSNSGTHDHNAPAYNMPLDTYATPDYVGLPGQPESSSTPVDPDPRPRLEQVREGHETDEEHKARVHTYNMDTLDWLDRRAKAATEPAVKANYEEQAEELKVKLGMHRKPQESEEETTDDNGDQSGAVVPARPRPTPFPHPTTQPPVGPPRGYSAAPMAPTPPTPVSTHKPSHNGHDRGDHVPYKPTLVNEVTAHYTRERAAGRTGAAARPFLVERGPLAVQPNVGEFGFGPQLHGSIAVGGLRGLRSLWTREGREKRAAKNAIVNQATADSLLTSGWAGYHQQVTGDYVAPGDARAVGYELMDKDQAKLIDTRAINYNRPVTISQRRTAKRLEAQKAKRLENYNRANWLANSYTNEFELSGNLKDHLTPKELRRHNKLLSQTTKLQGKSDKAIAKGAAIGAGRDGRSRVGQKRRSLVNRIMPK